MGFLLIPWFGFWRRFYGADKGKFPFNRLLGYALPLAVGLFFYFPVLEGKFIYLAGLIAALYLGMSGAKYAEYWDVKTVKDVLMMALNGLIVTLPAGLWLSFYHSWIFVLFGISGIIALPLGYYLGWKLPNLNRYLNRGPEWGEFLSWSLVGLVAAVLK